VGGWRFFSWNGDRIRDATVIREDAVLIVSFATPWEPQIISLEAIHPAGAFRGRSGTTPPAPAGPLSSLVIVDGTNDEPGSLEDAARLMKPNTNIGPDRPVSAYWEYYGDIAVVATIEITTARLDRPGFLRRLFGGTTSARRVRWVEEIQPVDGVARRTVALDVHTLPEGEYEIRVDIRLGDGEPVETMTHVCRSDAQGAETRASAC
jgi:hypothetical protein